jgi:integrase
MTPTTSTSPKPVVTSKSTPTPTAIDRKIRPGPFESILSKYKSRGLTTVTDYLLTKSRRSKRTATVYSFGIDYLNDYIERDYKNYNVQTILEPLKQQQPSQIDVYKLLDGFISYLQNDTTNGHDLSPLTLKLYMAAVKSYLAYNDIEVSPNKFKNKVTMPSVYHEYEEAIDANDIKEILNHCNNRRLKAYLLVLASGGMRAVEALAIRECDLDFSDINFRDLNDKSNPAGVRIRKEYAKTRTERHVFISNEAARYLKDWLDWKYRDRNSENKYLKNLVRNKDDLVFSMVANTSKNPHGLYSKVLIHFQRVLDRAGLKSRKEDGVYKRRKVTFHSFRRFVKTTIANQTRNSDYSEWFLGHKKSTYWVNKQPELRRIYKEECMKYLTFLDYPTVEAVGTSYAAKLREKDREIEELRQRDTSNTERIDHLETKIDDLLNQWEATVKDEGEMYIENAQGIRTFADLMKRLLALPQEQRTKEYNIFLSSIFEHLSKSGAKTESELMKIKHRKLE